MSTLIPRNIAIDEILVHYIFDRNFKRKQISKECFISKDVFIPNKGGVSLQRNSYISETNCKKLAKTIQGRVYVGFLIFKKSTFQKVKKNYIETMRKDFDAKIVANPLDDNFDNIPDTIKIYTNTLGNPAHADLIYINPAVQEKETPNIAIRSFSRKLAKECLLIFDTNPEEETYNEAVFEVLLNQV